MARARAAVLGILAIFWSASGWAANTVVPTTTLAAETGNNTSASNIFSTQSNGNIGQANISKEPTRKLLYSGSNTPIYAHFMPWFGSTSHMNVGYNSNDPAQVHRQVSDMLSRGIQGAIVDWYGPNASIEDQTTGYMMQDAQSRGGAFTFAIMYDGGALAACASSSCNLTNQAISDLTYAFNKYENSRAYMRTGGRPVVFFFDPDRYGTLNWGQISSSVPGNPIFVFRDPQGFTHSSSGGSFSWVGLNLSNSNDMGLSYFDSFYNTSLGYPQALTFGSGNKGFNDSLAAWSPHPPRVQSQQCGQTWLDTIAEAGKFFSAGRQLHAVQLVTWNDYEEGSEIETGIDNCGSVNASVGGHTLSWGVNGNLNTIDHFVIFISLDGSNLMPLATAAANVNSYDLSGANMGAGNYIVFVKAVGKPSLTNKMSAGATYIVSSTTGGTAGPAAANSVTPPSQAIAAGQTATYSVNVAALAGSNKMVSMSCSNLPANASCSFSPQTVSTNGGSGSATMKVSTASAHAAVLKLFRVHGSFALLMGFPALGFAFLGAGAARRRSRRLLGFTLLFLTLAFAALGCAGGAFSGSINGSTPAGTYGITISGVSAGTQYSTSVVLVVQ